MLAPLNVDARPHRVGSGIAQRVFAGLENPSVKIGPESLDGLPIRRELHPDHFVIARIVVVRKIDVVFPEQVIRDEALGRM